MLCTIYVYILPLPSLFTDLSFALSVLDIALHKGKELHFTLSNLCRCLRVHACQGGTEPSPKKMVVSITNVHCESYRAITELVIKA